MTGETWARNQSLPALTIPTWIYNHEVKLKVFNKHIIYR